jgi:predicted nucleotidyltransferase
VFEELLKRTASELDSQGIPYMIIGGQAVLLYGEPRLTKDIDITLGMGLEQAEKIISLASRLNFTPLVPDPVEFMQETMVFPTEDAPSGIRIDFILSQTPYEKQAIERGKKVMLGGTPVNFASLEDVIIHKVIAKRPRDIEDVKAIVVKNPSRDDEYIRFWLGEFDAALDEEFSKFFDLIIKEIE